MIVTFVHVWVQPEKINDFIDASIENHNASVKEPGNLRFDILQDAEDAAKFTLYEAYATEDAAKAHKETAHYKKWRNIVAGWMAKPRMGVKHRIIYPTDIKKW